MKVFFRIDGDEDPFDEVSKVPIYGVRWDIKTPPDIRNPCRTGDKQADLF